MRIATLVKVLLGAAVIVPATVAFPWIFRGADAGTPIDPPGLSAHTHSGFHGRSRHRSPKRPSVVKAPEIDASAGVQAIALVSGIVVLVGERSRRRRRSGNRGDATS